MKSAQDASGAGGGRLSPLLRVCFLSCWPPHFNRCGGILAIEERRLGGPLSAIPAGVAAAVCDFLASLSPETLTCFRPPC